MSGRKRKNEPGPSTKEPKKKKNSEPGLENFLLEVKKLKLYCDEDIYYKEAKIVDGPLILSW